MNRTEVIIVRGHHPIPLTEMESQAFLSLLPIGLSLLIGCKASPPLQKVNSLGNVTVGQILPNYPGSSSSGRAMGRVPSISAFLIHLLHPELPATCVDEECGEIRTPNGQVLSFENAQIVEENSEKSKIDRL